jgi:hypothetical protein
MLRPRSSGRALSPTLGKEVERLLIVLERFSMTESNPSRAEEDRVVGGCGFGLSPIQQEILFEGGVGQEVHSL